MANFKCAKCGYVFYIPNENYKPISDFVCEKCAREFRGYTQQSGGKIHNGCMYYGKIENGRLIKGVVIENTPTHALLYCSMRVENKFNFYILIENYYVEGGHLTWKKETYFASKSQALKNLQKL